MYNVTVVPKLLIQEQQCTGNSMNLACSLLIVPGTVYWEQAKVSFLFHVNCSLKSKYGLDNKKLAVPYILFREQKRCTRPIYYNFASQTKLLLRTNFLSDKISCKQWIFFHLVCGVNESKISLASKRNSPFPDQSVNHYFFNSHNVIFIFRAISKKLSSPDQYG